MVAFRAAVVTLLAFLGAGCCCGPCGPCCGTCFRPPCWYQPCPPCYGCGAPYGGGCPTCGPQFGWQHGFVQQSFPQPVPQYTLSYGTTAGMTTPTVTGDGKPQATPDPHFASFSAQTAPTGVPSTTAAALDREISDLKQYKADRGELEALKCEVWRLECCRYFGY